MTVSFAQDIKPLFTHMDVAHMRRFLVHLDDFDYMRKPRHAQHVLNKVSDGSMPPRNSGEPAWRPKQSSSSGIGSPADTSPS